MTLVVSRRETSCVARSRTPMTDDIPDEPAFSTRMNATRLPSGEYEGSCSRHALAAAQSVDTKTGWPPSIDASQIWVGSTHELKMTLVPSGEMSGEALPAGTPGASSWRFVPSAWTSQIWRLSTSNVVVEPSGA